jgi:hypothetical protein
MFGRCQRFYMLTTVEGTFRNGKVELNEQPVAHDGSRVLVTFLTPAQAAAPGTISSFGMLRSEIGRESTLDDFLEAKQALHKRIEDDNAD